MSCGWLGTRLLFLSVLEFVSNMNVDQVILAVSRKLRYSSLWKYAVPLLVQVWIHDPDVTVVNYNYTRPKWYRELTKLFPTWWKLSGCERSKGTSFMAGHEEWWPQSIWKHLVILTYHWCTLDIAQELMSNKKVVCAACFKYHSEHVESRHWPHCTLKYCETS